MVILTGDTHGEFDRIEEFTAEYETMVEDIMVILGDAGINYYLNDRDTALKVRLSRLPITLFCVHGNHEQRPEEIAGYEEIEWHGGLVWQEPEYPNLLFARDGEIYEFGSKKAIVIGGAYSVDKFSRLASGAPWFDNEQPDDVIRERVENALERCHWRVDYVFSHTVPLREMPRHSFLPGLDQSQVDNFTEKWLQIIEDRLDYDGWYAGHFHVTENVGKIRLLFEDYEELEV